MPDTHVKSDDTNAQIAHLRDQVEALMRDRVTPAVTDMAGRAETAHEQCRRHGARPGPGRPITGQVREQPLISVLVAVGVGYLLGRGHALSRCARFAPRGSSLTPKLLRLRLQARRLAVRVVLVAVALGFLVCALVLAHVAAWFWLRVNCGWMVQSTAALLAVGDLVVAGVLAWVALQCISGPGPVEIEARAGGAPAGLAGGGRDGVVADGFGPGAAPGAGQVAR